MNTKRKKAKFEKGNKQTLLNKEGKKNTKRKKENN